MTKQQYEDYKELKTITCIKYQVIKLFYALVFAGVLVFLGTLNAYMIIPQLGHQSVFLNILMYLQIAYTAFVCIHNTRVAKYKRDEMLERIYKAYLPVDNENDGIINFSEYVDYESTYDWMYN